MTKSRWVNNFIKILHYGNLELSKWWITCALSLLGHSEKGLRQSERTLNLSSSCWSSPKVTLCFLHWFEYSQVPLWLNLRWAWALQFNSEHSNDQGCLSSSWGCAWPGVGVTEALFVNSSVSKIFNEAKVPLRIFESHLYLTGATAAQLQWHLSNINVTLNSWHLFWQCLRFRKVMEWKKLA